MKADEQRELDRLCQAVIAEQDPPKLIHLVEKLNDFLEARERKGGQVDDNRQDLNQARELVNGSLLS